VLVIVVVLGREYFGMVRYKFLSGVILHKRCSVLVIVVVYPLAKFPRSKVSVAH